MRKNNNEIPSTRLAVLETKFEGMAKDIADIKNNHLVSINKKLDDLAKMFQARLPIWVSVTITLLTSASVGLLILYLTAISKI